MAVDTHRSLDDGSSIVEHGVGVHVRQSAARGRPGGRGSLEFVGQLELYWV